MLDDILPYYEQELTALRKLSGEFAHRYPRIASQLLLEDDGCEDPHVERMIESFAFLAGRIHKKLDDDFPQITDALLSVLYPHFLRPVPSMSIAQLAAAPGVELTEPQTVPRGTELLSRPVQGVPVRYRTAWPVQVCPVKIAEAAFEPVERSAFAVQGEDTVANVRIRLQTAPGAFKTLGIDRLRLYLDGESPLVHALYELLLNNVSQVSVHGTGSDAALQPLVLGAEAVQPVGFGADEGLLEYDPRSFLGYRLLQEYFLMPEKFLFVDLCGLDLSRFSADAVELRLRIRAFERSDRATRLEQTVGRDSFRLNCTPVVNLFTQMAEPIRLLPDVYEYPVIPDVRRPLGLEVYSIDAVQRASRSAAHDKVEEFLPFFSIRHGLHGNPDSCYWHARRHDSVIRDDDGSEMSISLVDRNMEPRQPAVETLSLRLTCTNRDLPATLPWGGNEGRLQVSDGGAIAEAQLLKKPTATWRAPMRKANQWRLISHLSLNHLSLVEHGREALLEILGLYNFGNSISLRKQIAGIVSIDSHASTLRVGRAPRQSFVRGTEIELGFDEDHFVGSGVYLLARVLDIFFGLYCTANSYTRLSVHTHQREHPLVRFPARSGALPLV